MPMRLLLRGPLLPSLLLRPFPRRPRDGSGARWPHCRWAGGSRADGERRGAGRGDALGGYGHERGSDEGAVPLPATVFAPPLSGSDDDGVPPPVVPAEAPTALMSGGSQLPPTAVVPGLDPHAPPPGSPVPGPAAPASPAPGAPGAPGAGARDIADAATSKATVPPRGARGVGSTTPPPPGAPGVPGVLPGATPPPSGPGAPGAPAGGYVPTQLVSQLGPPGAQPSGATPPPAPPGPPGPPGATPPPGAGCTMPRRCSPTRVSAGRTRRVLRGRPVRPLLPGLRVLPARV